MAPDRRAPVNMGGGARHPTHLGLFEGARRGALQRLGEGDLDRIIRDSPDGSLGRVAIAATNGFFQDGIVVVGCRQASEDVGCESAGGPDAASYSSDGLVGQLAGDRLR